MCQLNIDIPDRFLGVLERNGNSASEEFALAAAMKLYELGRLSSGAAAELAGIPRVVFLSKLGEYGVTFHYTEEELRRDVANAARQ